MLKSKDNRYNIQKESKSLLGMVKIRPIAESEPNAVNFSIHEYVHRRTYKPKL